MCNISVTEQTVRNSLLLSHSQRPTWTESTYTFYDFYLVTKIYAIS